MNTVAKMIISPEMTVEEYSKRYLLSKGIESITVGRVIGFIKGQGSKITINGIWDNDVDGYPKITVSLIESTLGMAVTLLPSVVLPETTDLGLAGMTEAQLDKIALSEAGIVGRNDTGVHRAMLTSRFGYNFRWVRTFSTLDRGDIIMSGVTPEKTLLLKRGKIDQLTDLFGIDDTLAAMIVVAGDDVARGKELPVIQFYLETKDSNCWKFFPWHPTSRTVNEWKSRNKIVSELSTVRLTAVKNLRDVISRLIKSGE